MSFYVTGELHAVTRDHKWLPKRSCGPNLESVVRKCRSCTISIYTNEIAISLHLNQATACTETEIENSYRRR
jgi:hypothetical protein